MKRIRSRRYVRFAALLAAGSLLLMACGGQDEPGDEQDAAEGTADESGEQGEDVAAFPEDDIEIIVSQEPGSSIDLSTRVVSDALQGELGVPVIVTNVDGAGGRVASSRVFNAEADGHTLLAHNFLSLASGELIQDADYDTLAFSPVGAWAISGHPFVTLEHDDSPEDMDAFIELAAERRVTVGTFGDATSSHMQFAVFAQHMGLTDNVEFVHFSGGSDAIAALLGRHIDAAIVGDGALVRAPADEVRPLVYFGNERSSLFPDLPAITEMEGDAASTEVIVQVIGLVAPPETPSAALSTLGGALETVLGAEDVIANLENVGEAPEVIDAAELEEIIQELYAAVEQASQLVEVAD